MTRQDLTVKCRTDNYANQLPYVHVGDHFKMVVTDKNGKKVIDVDTSREIYKESYVL